jgi:predicted nucleotidyltransferase
MLDLSHRQDLAWLAQLVTDVQTAAPNIRLLVVGALARDLWLHYGYAIEIERATEDVDLALAVDWKGFSETREALLATGLFEPFRNTAHKLRHRKFGWIDLIPFGAVERADGTIAWPPSGDDVMDVMGYAEANAAAITIALTHNQTVRAVSLPMLAVLKVLAWKDRHRTTRGKDAVDLALIMRRYLEAGNLDRLYADFAHVVDENFDFEPASAWLLGRDAREQLIYHSARFEQLISALDAVLAPELDPDGAQILVLQLNPRNPDDGLKLLGAFRKGMLGAEGPFA